MAKIYAPNKEYTGVSASVAFCNGVGHTDDKHLIQWFKEHGYDVEEKKPQKKANETPKPEPGKKAPEKKADETLKPEPGKGSE